jgi:hypothetical protein
VADDRRTQLFQTLTSLGVAPNVALGAMAGLAGESSVNFDPSSMGDASIPGGSVGIGQWNRERRQALINYAAGQKASPNDFGTQLGYLKQELSDPNSATYQAGVLNSLRNASSTAQGTKIWTSQFERPKVDNSEQRMQLTSQVGSVDANGNFTPGGGRAPARPVSPTPASSGPIDPSIIARGGYSPPIGMSLASIPGVTPEQSKALMGDLSNLDKSMGGKGIGGQTGGAEEPQQQPMGPAPPIHNMSNPGAIAPALWGNTLNSIQAPAQWGAVSPGQMYGANAGGQPLGQQFGTQLGSMQQLQQMMAMMGSPYGDAGYG